MSHTLAQNWLIELFVGNASYVQNKSLSPDGSWLSRLPFREMIEPMQVRRADQALYHHELTVSSLGSDCQSCTAPLR